MVSIAYLWAKWRIKRDLLIIFPKLFDWNVDTVCWDTVLSPHIVILSSSKWSSFWRYFNCQGWNWNNYFHHNRAELNPEGLQNMSIMRNLSAASVMLLLIAKHLNLNTVYQKHWVKLHKKYFIGTSHIHTYIIKLALSQNYVF